MSTYVPIQAITLSATTASVTFSGIPQTFTDLVLVCNTIVASGTGSELSLQFNDDTGTNYSNTYLLGNGSAAVSGRGANFAYADCGYLSANAGNPNTRIINIQNYSNITTNKTLVSRASGDNGQQVTAYANLWRSTAAINKIKVYSASSLSYASGSTFTLYGIGVGSPKAFGGNTVTTDGTYWYHTFRSSGLFIPTTNLTNVDYLVVAGGGGGGILEGGGGGAGGFRTSAGTSGGGGSAESKLSLTSNTSYTVTIGAGGTGAIAPSGGSIAGTNGSNSIFSTITSTGGGAGGGSVNGNPSIGGSGGGGKSGGNGGSASSGAAGTANQGYAGGTGTNSQGGGGGGGAGAVGANGSGGSGGAGGAGVASSISGSSVTYGGGGGGSCETYSSGGAGGAGGGGAGTTNGGNGGTANTGGGGGGGNYNYNNGGPGGSGIVIVRYAV